MTRLALTTLATLLLAAPLSAQGDVDDWCIQRAWCNGPSHTVLTAGTATLLAETTPLDVEESRWVPVAFYVGKEVRDRIRWGDDLSWTDTAADLGFVALGWWLSGHVSDWMHGG